MFFSPALPAIPFPSRDTDTDREGFFLQNTSEIFQAAHQTLR